MEAVEEVVYEVLATLDAVKLLEVCEILKLTDKEVTDKTD